MLVAVAFQPFDDVDGEDGQSQPDAGETVLQKTFALRHKRTFLICFLNHWAILINRNNDNEF